MSPIRAASLYQETRLNLDAALPGSTIDLLIPANNASAFASRSSPKRRRLDQSEVKYDEETFSKLHLASESSIYFRPHTKGTKHHQTPRAILWRILEDRKVLELQAVDLSQDQAQRDEALLTLRFAFPTAIRPCGVVFAEEDQHDEKDTAHRNFVTYVVTTSGELFTLRLGRAAFVKLSGPGSLDKSGGEWCTSFTSSAFTYRTPYRLLANSARELWASLSDGSLVRFQRESNTAQKWRETFFMEGGWKATVRGLIVWKPQNNISYGDTDLHPTTACSLMESQDGKHIWTVCLDHTLKAWDIETGKVVFVSDLANDINRDLQKPYYSLLDPARSQLLQICPGRREGEYSVVTFSPNSREFKFWHVNDADVAQYGADDILPDFKLVPPMEELIDANIWTLENFHANPPHSASSHQWSLWILVRSGARCHTFQIAINLDDHVDKLSRSWRQNWSKVHSGSKAEQSLATPSLGQANEVWQDFLFYPGRYTAPTLETALAVYWKSLSKGLQNKKQFILHSTRPLCDQICETMELSVTLAREADDTIAFERHDRDLATQWQIFFGAVKDLHKRQDEVLSMAYDADQDLAWVIMADQISPIRASSEVEVLLSNKDAFGDPESLHADSILLQALEDSRNAEIAQLVNAAGVFKQSFSKTSLTELRALLATEAMQELHDSEDADLLDTVYNRSGISGQVSDDDYSQLTHALAPLGGFANLDNDIFTSALALLVESQKGHHQRQLLTHYGARFLICGAQETLQMSSDMIFNLLILVLFIGGELEEKDLPETLDTHNLFIALLQKLKELELLSWMAGTLRPERSEASSSSMKATPSESKELVTSDHSTDKPAGKPLTVLESIFIGDWASMMFPTGPEAVLLTYWCRAWTFGARLSDQYDNIACHIMGSLLKSTDIDLATDFRKFMPETRWATYLIARFYLASGGYAEAARYFNAAAEDLATGRYLDIEQIDSANILDLEERNYFNEGLPAFYQHVVSLFEKAGLLSFVADFAQQGLDAQKDQGRADPNVRSDLLSRLFNAALQASRYETACTALQQFTDQALLKSSLTQLLKSLLSTPQGPKLLLTLPFPAPHLVDAYLSSLATSTTNPFISSSNPAASTSLLTSHTAARPSTGTTSNPHKLLYSYRLQRTDLRGAATTLWDRLQLLRAVRDGEVSGSIGFGIGGNEELDGEIKECYLGLLNLLGLMDGEEAWILTRPLVGSGANDGEAKAKRRVVTLNDVRRAWQEELDGRADVSAGRVPLFGRVGTKGKGKGIAMKMNGAGKDVLGGQRDGHAMDVDVFA